MGETGGEFVNLDKKYFSSAHPDGRDDQSLVLEALDDLRVGFREVPGELDAPLVVPGAHPLQPVLLQLDDLEAEVRPQPALVELHLGKNKHR